MSHKTKISRRPLNNSNGPHDVKAAIIRKHGTIAEFIRSKSLNAATVYAAIKNRRNGPTSRRIRELALK